MVYSFFEPFLNENISLGLLYTFFDDKIETEKPETKNIKRAFRIYYIMFLR